MRVPVKTKQFKRDFVQEEINGEQAELVRALIPMEDAQASFQILRLSAASRLSHLFRTVPSSITCQAAANSDILVDWVLASIIAGDRAAAAGLPTPEGNSPRSHRVPNSDLPGTRGPTGGPPSHPKGGLGLTSSRSINAAAYNGYSALVLGRVVAASTRGNLPSLL